ncbi:DUF481 domain-containing protein [Nafulsella turpanensis]|uniref:DUF481 domain-containing protein n=1 Tax=Nafulsella turpanensis TaxID=1265690 RepID=UPI00034B1B0E|nr:DUF481 domain-containing protein [Nafulsella turpanensis]
MRTALLLLFLLAAVPGIGQILNIEQNRKATDTTHYWTGELNFNLLIHNNSATTEDPVRYIGIGTGADVAYTSVLHRYLLINQLNYSAITGNAFISTGYSHFRANLLWRQPLSYELFAQAQYDIGRGLDSRYLSGGGIRYTFVREKKVLAALGVGAMFERERWQIPATELSPLPGEQEIGTVTTHFIKSSNYLSLRWQINKMVNLNTIVYFQTGYDQDIDAFRNRFSGNADLNVKLGTHLTFFTNFTGAYDSRPVVPIVNFVYSLNNGLKVAL